MGDQTLFVSTDEVKAMWKTIDPIIKAWQENKVELDSYEPDTNQAVDKGFEKVKSKEGELLVETELFDKIDMSSIEVGKEKSVGIIGMGKMGGNIAKRLSSKGWKVIGYQRNQEKLQMFRSFGIIPAKDVADLVAQLPLPKIILLMLPAGEATHNVLFGDGGLLGLVKPGDYIIDGSNNFYEATQNHYRNFALTGINFVDMGISGGPNGALNGACLMIGGRQESFEHLKDLYRDMAQDGTAYEFFEGEGAGHFIKMVHNGIEYGMMQSIAEGFNLLKNSPFSLDLKKVTRIYQAGSVIESRLVGWLGSGYEKYGQDLGIISGSVAQTGEGMWTVDTASKMGQKVDSIKLAVDFRTRSQNNPSYTGQVLSVLRHEFGGHDVKQI